MKKKILAIFAHPDDEVLACGATLAKRIDNGHEVSLIILSNGCDSRQKSNKHIIKKRKENCLESCKKLGIKLIDIGDFPDNQFDKEPLLKIIKFIEEKSLGIKPNEIFTHYRNDLNIDHRITYNATKTAFRPINLMNQFILYESEVNSSTEWNISSNNSFSPNHFENIEKYIIAKNKALKCYRDEIRKWPHPRSIKGIKVLSEYRGMQSGYINSEAFIINFSRN
jgi:LmbE family N-acetylglucosaminyl deacetylase